MKREIVRAAAVCVAAALLCALTGCAPKKLAEGFDEAAVISAAEEVAALLNGGDYETVAAMVADDIKGALSAEVISDVIAPAVAEAGAFIEVEKTVAVGTEDKDTGADYATVVVVAKYENASHAFTVTFDTDMNIKGLYFK